MSRELSRRQFLGTSLGAFAASALLSDPTFAHAAFLSDKTQPSTSTTLRTVKRTLDINGKSANVMGILQPNGTQGMTSAVDIPFNVTLENQLPVPTAIHWHGLHPPNNEDGVPGVTQPVIAAGAGTSYDFPLRPAGTHWMHSHQGLQEAFLLAAPLIVHDPADHARDQQEVVIMLGDFSFTPPPEIYANLRKGPKPGAKMDPSKPDANDVDYDAYIANDRTLLDPDVIKVEKGVKVRLRIINGSSGTNYFIDLGALTGEAIATDGMPIKPVRGSRFPLAIAQRLDVIVHVPREGGAFPILALRELAAEQTGIVLATPGAKVAKLPVKTSSPTGLLNLDFESGLNPVTPLATKPVDVTSVMRLQGNMMKYEWLINDVIFNVANPGSEKPQLLVKPGQRAAIKFVNETPMSHPMHLHGHSFQVVAINDRRINGPLRDTVLVPGKTNVTVEFDANNPGLWYVHCHILWHLDAGMAALVQYQA